MLDALDGAGRAGGQSLVDVARGAADGAAGTAQMRARFGRASYVGQRAVGSPDAGAVGIALLIALIASDLDPEAAPACRRIIAELTGPAAGA